MKARTARRGKDSGKASVAALVVGIAALAALPYLNSLGAGFALDDIPRVVENPMVRGTASASVLTWVDRPEIYRPLTMLTFVANARAGPSAVGYHVVNVLLHVLVSVAAFAVTRIVLRSIAGAAAAAAVFAVHPIHSEAVTNVFGRSELLAAVLVLVSLATLARGEAGAPGDVAPGVHRGLWRVVSVASFAAALLAKESAVTAVGLCGIVYLWISTDRRRAGVVRALLPYVLVAVVFVAWRRYLVGAFGMPTPPHFIDNPLAHAALGTRLGTATVIVAQYVGLLVWPVTLSSDYSFNQVPLVTSPRDPRLLGALGLLAALAAGVAFAWRRAPQLVVAAGFACIPLAVTANVLVVIGTIKAERLLYLPSVGWCIALGWGTAMLARRWPRTTWAALGAIVVLLGARTWARNDDWRDDATAHAAAVRTAPDSAKSHYNRGRDLLAERRVDEAIGHLRRSVAIYPGWAAAETNLGGALALAGSLPEATEHLAAAARLDPTSAPVHASLARTLLRQARGDEALAALETASRLDPRLPGVAYQLGTLYLQRGRLREAAEQLAAAAALQPDHADTHNNLGVVLLGLGKVEDAVARFETALRLKPDYPHAQQNLRIALARQSGRR